MKAKFQKKPIIVSAEQYDRNQPPPEGVCMVCIATPHVHTIEGPLNVSHLDWIITGVKGEQYPCKPDIFAATYEPVPEEESCPPNSTSKQAAT